MSMQDSRKLWASQLKVDKFWFKYGTPGDFHKSQWGDKVLPYAIYRTVVLILMILMEVQYRIEMNLGVRVWTFDTYWSFLFITVGFFVSAVNTWIYYFKQGQIDAREDISWNVKLQWILAELYQAKAFIVTVVFWIFIWDPDTWSHNLANTTTHIINLLIVLVDMAVSRAPVRLLHFWVPTTWIFVYAIFTIIHWQAGEPPIYVVISYSITPAMSFSLLFAGVFFLTPFMHLVVFTLYWARQCLWWFCSKKCGAVGDSSTAAASGTCEDVPMITSGNPDPEDIPMKNSGNPEDNHMTTSENPQDISMA